MRYLLQPLLLQMDDFIKHLFSILSFISFPAFSFPVQVVHVADAAAAQA